MERDEAIKTIRANLRRRSGKAWSVTGGRGTAWGWIRIQSPPKRRVDDYYLSEDDQVELGELLGLDRPAHSQGVSIPPGSDYQQEYVDRSAGITPSVHGVQYWD